VNHSDARKAVAALSQRYVGKSYEELAALIDLEPDVIEVEVSGVIYQVEFNVDWDDKPGGPLRVMFNVDDRGMRAYFPLCLDDLVAPSQSFEGNLA
jgi:hypothetical protein